MSDAHQHAWICLLLLTLITLTAGQSGNAAETIQPSPAEGNGQRDFDFEFGAWKVKLSRLTEALAGSDTWVDYEGTSVVRKVWNGRANLGELDVEGPSGRIQGLSLRLYNPQTRQWNISWASSRDGVVGAPMTGGFLESGRGRFYGEDTYDGRPIFARFIFSEITDTSFRFEQAFSEDGGQTWETNWFAHFTRDPGATDS